MKRICAWCGLALDESDSQETLEVTHGVCRDCRRRFFAPPGNQEDECRNCVPKPVSDHAGEPGLASTDS
jgi:hypothetical protein